MDVFLNKQEQSLLKWADDEAASARADAAAATTAAQTQRLHSFAQQEQQKHDQDQQTWRQQSDGVVWDDLRADDPDASWRKSFDGSLHAWQDAAWQNASWQDASWEHARGVSQQDADATKRSDAKRAAEPEDNQQPPAKRPGKNKERGGKHKGWYAAYWGAINAEKSAKEATDVANWAEL